MLAFLAGDDAEIVVLDLVQSHRAERQMRQFVGRHGAMKPVGRVSGCKGMKEALRDCRTPIKELPSMSANRGEAGVSVAVR
jgi:hypothetical protein